MRGTIEGELEEKKIVQSINKRDPLGVEILEKMKFNFDDVFAVNVTGMVFGKIQKKKIKPKSDIYLFKSDKIKIETLVLSNYYLSEKDFKPDSFLEGTGISVKLADSRQYQILKINPSIFKLIYGNNLLAAGASIYCSKLDEFEKNNDVLRAWGVSEKDFINYFSEVLKDTEKIFNQRTPASLKAAREVKTYCNNEIKRISIVNKKISDYIFRGYGNFEEPYVANWIYEKGEFNKLTTYDFTVTTGSGRSRGDFTIVFKPV